MTRPLFLVERAGLLTSVQDLGRWGYEGEGLGSAGAMDPYALVIANLLTGNDAGEAALEITLQGPTVQVLNDCRAAVCGADISATIDGIDAPLWQAFPLNAGQILRFGRRVAGARAYIAVAGGFDIPIQLGSRSTALQARFGGFHGRPLAAGDTLNARKDELPTTTASISLSPAEIPIYRNPATARVVEGPHGDLFHESALPTLLSGRYFLRPNSDRMGPRLDGPSIATRSDTAGFLSEPTVLGAIQVPPDGMPIVLCADRQTIGGYPVIAVVASVDRSVVAQLAPGDELRFAQITLDQAREEWFRRERLLKIIACGVGRRFDSLGIGGGLR